eukprot:Awhi_evm1s11554
MDVAPVFGEREPGVVPAAVVENDGVGCNVVCIVEPGGPGVGVGVRVGVGVGVKVGVGVCLGTV